MTYAKTAYRNFKPEFTMTASIRRARGAYMVVETRSDRPDRPHARWYGIKTREDAERFVTYELGYRAA